MKGLESNLANLEMPVDASRGKMRGSESESESGSHAQMKECIWADSMMHRHVTSLNDFVVLMKRKRRTSNTIWLE